MNAKSLSLMYAKALVSKKAMIESLLFENLICIREVKLDKEFEGKNQLFL